MKKSILMDLTGFLFRQKSNIDQYVVHKAEETTVKQEDKSSNGVNRCTFSHNARCAKMVNDFEEGTVAGTALHYGDFIVIAIYFVFVLVVGLWVSTNISFYPLQEWKITHILF